MFEDFECDCIYVEVVNDRVPKSGRVEYRAKLCVVCRARGSLLPADGRPGVRSTPTRRAISAPTDASVLVRGPPVLAVRRRGRYSKQGDSRKNFRT